MKKQIIFTITTVLIILLITTGLSYAYFTANLTGTEDSTTITITGGSMNITYDGGADININNIIPSDNPAAIKTFTVTGNNTTDIKMKYQISLVVEENTFSEDALKYKLISTNTDSSGEVAPSKTELTKIGTGYRAIRLGSGYFDVPTNGNKIHTYKLEIYFPTADYNQNIDQGKEFEAYISISEENDTNQLLTDLILNQDGGITSIEAKEIPDFNQINGDSGLYSSVDEYGTSYYYRGVKDELNNNLIYGGFQWKIVRINGDNSIRIIYNGTEEQFNINKTVNLTGEATQINNSAWNETYSNDAKYIGYMYGGTNGIASTVRNGDTSIAATYNETSTSIKITLDNWYKTNILDKGLTSVVDNIFCNDRQLIDEIGGEVSGLGYGATQTNYAGYHRTIYTKNPNLKCGLKNDRFTTGNSSLGNGALTYPIGLLSIDEALYAGLKYDTANNINYLYTNESYWTMTPYGMYANNLSYTWLVYSHGGLNVHSDDVTKLKGVRPVISIDSSVLATGTGSATDPFRI